MIWTNRVIVLVADTAIVSTVFLAGRAVAVDVPDAEYISDATADRIIYTAQDWGTLGMNTAVVPPGGEPARLRIKDTHYERGLGHHANGEIYVELNGRYRTFEAQVGVQWQGGKLGSVVFSVFVDDEKRFETGVMTGDDEPREVRIPVDRGRELRLVAADAGDGISHDCANWADARLIRNPAASGDEAAGALDAAPFARLVTWDPNRTDGARAKRTEEFRAEDVFLATEVLPAADGTVRVPVADNGLACIGLEWVERRVIRKLGLRFADPASVPPLDGVQVQYWQGESAWQGNFKPLQTRIAKSQDRLTARVSYVQDPDARAGIQKIRWIFPAGEKPIVLRGLSAWTISPWDTARLRVELERPLPIKDRPMVGHVEAYNGVIVSPDDSGSPLRCGWDLSGPLPLEVRYCKPRPWKTDRTVLRFRLPGAAFGVAVEDVLASGCVYIPHAGVFVIRDPSPMTPAEYRRRIASQKTVLQRVREMPDQTFGRAWAKVHNPVQDKGPMLLSLACDNRKFVAHRDGSITFDVYEAPDQAVPEPRDYSCKLLPRFGFGASKQITRQLYDGWLPVPVTMRDENGVTYLEWTFVAPYDNEPIPTGANWLHKRALCVAEFTVHNTGPRDAEASLTLRLLSNVKSNEFADLQQVDKGVIARKGERLLAFVDMTQAAPLEADTGPAGLTLSGTLPAGKSARCFVYIPAWPVSPEDYALLGGGLKWLQKVEAYWQRILAPAMQIELPDALLTNVIRASQVHCLLAARNEDEGERIAAWIASDRYGPLESEAHSVIRGMDMMGHDDFARRSLEFFIKRYNPAGFLTTGYTVMGTGWHLWTLAEHYGRTRDRDWLSRVGPEVARLCSWIARQCEKTRHLDARGEKMPEYGLVPPGVAADWNRYAYRFIQEAHYYAGLDQAARALADINHPDAPSLLAKADEFGKNVRRAFRWVQTRSPVLPLANGTWVPACPGMLYCFGRIGDIIPGEDANRSWGYDVDLGAHHLAALGVLDPETQDVAWITDHMEDAWFLHSGMGDYPAERSQQDFFSLGGFSKIQPYYCRIAEIYALRDDVKPFIRSYFNTIPSLLSKETLSFWEHFHNIGAWNKTHETGYFLAQTRLMLVMERGDDLWLAPLVTNNWLKDGMQIVVRNAPTRFGKVSYTITSSVDRGFVEAVIHPPTRSLPKQLVIRLRHPQGKPIQAVTVNGQPYESFDSARDCIRIEPIRGPITIRAEYEPA